MSDIKTMKVMPWGAEQGDFVIINESDFDPKVHTAYEEPKPDAPKAPTKADLQAALDAKGIAYPATANKADLQALLDAAPAQ